MIKRCESLPQPKRKQNFFKRSTSFSLPKSPSLSLACKESQLQEMVPSISRKLSGYDGTGLKKAAPDSCPEDSGEFSRKERKLSPGSFSLKISSCSEISTYDDDCDYDLCCKVKQCIIAKSISQDDESQSLKRHRFPNSIEFVLGEDIPALENGDKPTDLSFEEPVNDTEAATFTPPTPPIIPPHMVPPPPFPTPEDILHGSQPIILMQDQNGFTSEDNFFLDMDTEDQYLCIVCYSSFEEVHKISIYCSVCSQHICLDCMQLYLKTQITEGFVRLKCPCNLCTRVVSDNEVEQYCTTNQMKLYFKNKVDAENNPRRKTCPGCNIVHSFDEPDEIPLHHKCSFCGLQWCVPCHAPWHVGMTCKKYEKDVVGKGRKALKVWAKGKGKCSANARKCPKCRFFIERTLGCDHMVCSRYAVFYILYFSTFIV